MKKLFILLALTSILFPHKNKILAQNLGKPGPNITDVEGNSYKTVFIGTQTWMAENLKTSKYNDGTNIPNITDNSGWWDNTTGAWVYYNDGFSNITKYGKLYNWYAVSSTTNGSKNICPTGWHVPTDDEWTLLINYLGGNEVAGGKMKEAGTKSWAAPNAYATNTSLFTGLPGGHRHYTGDFGGDDSGYWWSSTEYDDQAAWFYSLMNLYGNVIRSYDNGDGSRNYDSKSFGYSVRCLKD